MIFKLKTRIARMNTNSGEVHSPQSTVQAHPSSFDFDATSRGKGGPGSWRRDAAGTRSRDGCATTGGSGLGGNVRVQGFSLVFFCFLRFFAERKWRRSPSATSFCFEDSCGQGCPRSFRLRGRGRGRMAETKLGLPRGGSVLYFLLSEFKWQIAAVCFVPGPAASGSGVRRHKHVQERVAARLFVARSR
jgi:hypothetical protein